METIGAAIGVAASGAGAGAASTAGIMGAAALPGAIGTGGAVFGGLEALAAAGAATAAAPAGLGLAASMPWAFAGLSAASNLFSGVMQFNAFNERARWDEISARNEELKGRLQSLRIREAASRDVANAMNRYGAAGIDLSSGVVGSQEDAINQMAENELAVVRYNTEMAAAGDRASASSSKSSAWGSLASGIAGAFRPLSLIMASRESL